MSGSSSEPRRYLIAIGSPRCDKMEGFRLLDKVESDLGQVTRLFERQGYTRELSDDIDLADTTQRIKDAVCGWFSKDERQVSDIVVVYYGGHGYYYADNEDDNVQFNSHYLLTLDSTKKRLFNTAIETKEFVKYFFGGDKNRSPQNILLILDTCYAGAGGRQMSSVLSELRGVAPPGSGFWILSSSDALTEAGDGAFVKALEAVVQDENGELQEQGEFLSIDFLVSRINQQLKSISPGQSAIADSVGIQAQAAFIRNPRFTAKKQLQSRLPSVDPLLSILQQIPQDKLNRAYQQCYPESIDYALPSSIEALLLTLIQLPQGNAKHLPTFISLLAQDTSLIEQYLDLEAWGRQNLSNFAEVLAHPPLTNSELNLMVYVCENKQQRDRYTIQACLIGNSSVTLPTPGDEDIAVVAEQIPRIVAALVDDVANRVDDAISDLSIQCFLPKKLLHLAIDQAEIEIDGIKFNIGSICKSLVVRSSERQSRSASHGNWRKRWRHYDEATDCQSGLILHENDRKDVCEGLDDYMKLGCAFEGQDDLDVHVRLFAELFLEGVPIAIWLRPGHPFPQPHTTLKSLLDGYLGELPVSLTKRRKKDRRDRSDSAKVTHHVTLLWDNPDQPFPTDDWNGRSKYA